MRGRAVVVGAGIGGLAAAIGLQRAGWDVEVLDQAESPQPVGAGISLWSNALRALRCLGVESLVREQAVTSVGGGMRSPSGRWVSRSYGEQLAEGGEMSMVMVHRAQLHEVLAAQLRPGTVRYGARVERIEPAGPGSPVTVSTGDGDPRTADVVVGADGIRSLCRRRIRPGWDPQYAGFVAWRGVTEAPFPLAELSQTLGRGAEFGLTQLVDGRVYWFGTGAQAAGEPAGDERAEVLRRFGSWHAPIREVVEATPARAVLRHDLYRLPRPFRSFVGPDAEPRVALLGDAAHAIVPNLGQGGCLALEDAVELSHSLASAFDVPTALRRYDAARRPRSQRIAALSDRAARMSQARSRLATALRAVVFAAMPPRLVAAGLERAIDWTPPDGSAAARSTT